MATHALNRHLVLVGFMGAGKTTVGREVALRLGREFTDVDEWVGDAAAILRDRGRGRLSCAGGSGASRSAVGRPPGRHCRRRRRGRDAGGRERCSASAFVVLLEVDVETAWARVSGSDRPLAQDEAEFRRRYELRRPLYDEVADARARDADDVVLAAAGVHVEVGALERLGELVPGPVPWRSCRSRSWPESTAPTRSSPSATVSSRSHELPTGERAKTVSEVERLWRALRIGRNDTLLALGGGALTDAAGFVAATFARGCPCLSMTSSLVGQVDAAIGGKTGIDLPEGKNLVGAFHWPVRTVIDPALLETLPAAERLNGMAEVVKTGLLAGEPLWELPDAELVRRCAAFKSALCLRDPHDDGPRHVLNLGHTFGHALEAAAGYELPHGRAVALGLLAALRLSGRPTDTVEDVLAPGTGARRPRARVGGPPARQEGAAARHPPRRRGRLRGRVAGAGRPCGPRRADRRVDSAPCASSS